MSDVPQSTETESVKSAAGPIGIRLKDGWVSMSHDDFCRVIRRVCEAAKLLRDCKESECAVWDDNILEASIDSWLDGVEPARG